MQAPVRSGLSRDFGWETPGAPEKFEKKACVQFFSPKVGCDFFPVGQKRQIDVAGQKLPRDNFCLSLVSAITLTAGLILKEDKKPSLVGERQFWEAF